MLQTSIMQLYTTENILGRLILVVLAKLNGEFAGAAGASKTCASLWQIGVDVYPEYRKWGVGELPCKQINS